MPSKFTILILSCMAFINVANAQRYVSALQNIHHFSIGISGGEFSDNSWAGVEVSSPAILHNRVCFRLKGNLHWLEQYKARYDRWAKFSTLNPSIVIYTNISEHVRWYVDVGPFFIFPQNKISDTKYISGINAIAGVEVFIMQTKHTNLCYHFGMGAGFANASADKLENSPCYSNGLIFSNGFRFYF